MSKPQPLAPPTDQDIDNAIEQSGYPLEQRVATALAQAGFAPIPSWTWWDARQQTEREVDVVATAEFAIEPRGTLFLHVLVEAKAAKNGIVLFEAETTHDHWQWLEDVHFWGTPASILSPTGGRAGYPITQTVGWGTTADGAVWAPAATSAFQYAKVTYDKNAPSGASKWKLSHDDVHASIDGLCRALPAYHDEFGNAVEGYDCPYLNLAVPLVVIEGPLRVFAPSQPTAPTRHVERATYYRRGFVPRASAEHYRVVTRIDFVQEAALARVITGLHADGSRLAAWAAQPEIYARLRAAIPVFGNTRERRNRPG